MAITIDWGSRVIHIPKSYLTLVSGVIYTIDLNQFRLDLKDLEDDEGLTFPDTHNHNTQTVLSGDTYARQVEIINSYTVEFEDGQYTVKCVGANHNLADVKVPNQVSLIVGNSAGLIVAGGSSSSGLTIDQDAKLSLIAKLLRNKLITNPATGVMTLYDDDGTTVLLSGALYEDVAGSTPYRGQGADRRDRLA